MAEEMVASVLRVGEGPIPARLDRFNPGAFLLAGLWSLGYGTWPWVFGFVAITAVNTAVGLVFSLPPQTPWPLVVGRQLFAQLVVVAFSAVYSFRANRLRWEKENRRIYTQETPHPPATVEKFESDQRKWLIGGLAFVVYMIALPLLMPPLRTPVMIASQIIWAAVELGALGVLYSLDRSRGSLGGQS